MEPELISASGRDMATCLSGEAVGVDLLMRNGCTWRTIVSVWRRQLYSKECVVYVCAEAATACLVTSGWVVCVHTVVSIVLRRQRGLLCCGMRAWPGGGAVAAAR